jgi:hypothetical protein
MKKLFLELWKNIHYLTHCFKSYSNFNFKKMTSADFILSAQRRFLNLYENANFMTPEQLERAYDGILYTARQLVLHRREELRTQVIEIPTPGFRTITPPGTPPASRAISPPPAPEARRYPPAEIRPATVPRTFPNLFAAAEYRAQAEETARGNADWEAASTRYTAPVRPSQLLREIRVSLDNGVTPVSQHRNHISWEVYSASLIKKRAIGQTRFEANCTEPCAICLDTHTNGDSVVTEECNHCFGKECWKNWMSNPAGNQTCPTCREHRPKVITYTMRRPRSNAIVDDNISEITLEN